MWGTPVEKGIASEHAVEAFRREPKPKGVFDLYFAAPTLHLLKNSMGFDKTDLRAAIVARLQADLSLQTRAALSARDEATHEESRAENKYDTHSQEAAYLAEGQAKLAAEIEAGIALYSSLPLVDFTAADAIALGAVVELRARDRSTWYFLGPRGGGLELALGGKTILVLTPASPLGRQLLGRRVGEIVSPPGRGPVVPHHIESVC
jgi:transcription elongation GreA/GreB family factor